MSEFSDFTKLVLARMETNPSEFEPNNRWDTLVRALEAHAMGDTDSRYMKVLWPLEEFEIEALLTRYRKMYLDRLHKDMLKNIVSGDDLQRTKGYAYDSGHSNDVNPIKRGPLTVNTLANQALGALNTAFDDAYAATPKMEGAQVPMSKYVATEQRKTAVKKILITPTDHKMAHKLGIDVREYVRLRNAAE